jgi:hypothetical protein
MVAISHSRVGVPTVFQVVALDNRVIGNSVGVEA